ncbi:GATOR complex protein WDR59-like isoform X1 [Haliotis rubra]|uniref:GATOR complex protein WDR59-like isoform X1 n=1 Tax=Haliotis rubra TaxID=36100 RepID=UPI001EE62E02|nr:GATOR complex protein WDR59-like isoform X1 [Haliotis rubra]
MATQWSSEHFVAEYRDIQANAMAVDTVGEWALLGGRRALALVNLYTPKQEVVRIARQAAQAKWDINCIQFNPHACKANMFVTASNQRLEVLQLSGGNTDHRCSLKAHTRTVSDVDWSPFDVNQLTSCSVDTYTYLWDIRDPKKPAATFQSVAGASQVKWNKVVNNMFATTHEGDIRIWDPRKGNTPIQYIAAHLSKIHGLDWNPNNQYKLVTASQDCFVRFWDCTNHRRSEFTLNTGSPVWRARLTPFGNGLMTVVVPQLRRGENKLYLWNTSNLTQPIHTFVGHKDVVLEFHWRKQTEGVRDQQLVTWSRDQSLRIWRIDSALQELCGHDTNNLPDLVGDLCKSSPAPLEPANDSLSTIDENPTVSEPIIIQSVQGIMSNQPQTLQQEFSLVNKNIPHVTIEEMDAINRVCKVTAQIGKRRVSLNLNFPPDYPNNASPSFQFLHSTLDATMQKQLIKVLTDTSQKHVKRNMNCLEPCLRQLITELDTLTKTERKTPDLDIPFPLTQQQNMMQTTPIYPMYSFGSFQDSSVPFPRTSGARFCSVGVLVIFGRSAVMKKHDGTEPTPKALSELAAFARPSQNATPFAPFFPRSPPTPSNEGLSISDFYTYKERRHRTRSRSRVREVSESRYRDTEKAAKKLNKVAPVKVYDVSALLTVNKQLAENYKLDLSDIPGMCSHNAAAAATVGRKDLVQIWNYVSVMLPASLNPSPTPTSSRPFAMCAFGRPLLKTMLDHYSSNYDVQTLAMLCCVFWNKEDVHRAAAAAAARSASKTSLEYTPANTDANITYLGSSTDSGWSLLQSHAQSQAPMGHPGPQHPTAHGGGPLSEVASHPNLSALFKQAVLKNKRSNSWSDSCDDYRILDEPDPAEKAAQWEQEQHENNCKMLDPTMWSQYDLYKKAYSNLLYSWGLHNQAAHILKFISTSPPPHKGVEFSVRCTVCHREARGPQCTSCKHLVLECAICHTGVRGAANFCISCSHGGHTEHMAEWFRTELVCPTGCGCECLKAPPMLTA